MADMTTPQKEKLVADLQLVIADAEDLMRATADQVGEGVAEYRSRLKSRLAKTRADLERLQDTALAKARAAGHVADDYVHDHPWKAMGAAAGIGLIVGLLIGRR